MMESNAQRVAIVTGSSGGIGLGIALAMAKSGVQVVITGRESEACAAAMRMIVDAGGEAIAISCDVGDSEDSRTVIERTLETFGSVDILVNNVANSPHQGQTIDVSPSDWEQTLAINLTAPLRWSQLCWHVWMKTHGGNIVNISSVGGLRAAHPMMGPYALIHLTSQLAAELAPSVRVNAVAPGLVRTEFSRSAWEGGLGEQIAEGYPLQRLGEPMDVANSVLFLVSDEANWITGQTLVVNGGGLDPFDWETRPGRYSR
jgi:hypothetical protein